MENKKEKSVRVHPAPPTALTQEIPTPDTVHSADVPTAIMAEQGHQNILSDVLGSYTGTGIDDTMPEQDADDL